MKDNKDIARFNYIDVFYKLCITYALLFPEERDKLQLNERHKSVYLAHVGPPGDNKNIDKFAYLAKCRNAIALDPDLRYDLPIIPNDRYKKECLELLEGYRNNRQWDMFLSLSEGVLSVYPETKDKVRELTVGREKTILDNIALEKEGGVGNYLFRLARLRMVNPQIFDQFDFTLQDFQKLRDHLEESGKKNQSGLGDVFALYVYFDFAYYLNIITAEEVGVNEDGIYIKVEQGRRGKIEGSPEKPLPERRRY